MTRFGILAVVVLVAACTAPPKNLAGRFDPVTVPEAQQQPRQGLAVRWGGRLAATRPVQDQTCFEVVSQDLDSEARPVPSDETGGRFMACAPGFYDPMVYVPGREVTVVGALNGTTSQRVGGYDYTFPRVDATTVYLWPDRLARPSGPPIAISIGGVFGHVFH